MKTLAIVPARCGSKGFPHKNIAKLEGITLLELAVKVALECELIDDVYISTDCKEYEIIALRAGAKSLGLRRKDLAGDNSKTVDAVISLILQLELKYDHLVLLQPTAPLRTPKDITSMLNNLENSEATGCVSVTKLEEPHPYKLKTLDDNGYMKPFISGTTSETPRQLLPEAYMLNGAIYTVNIESLLEEKTFFTKNTLSYIMRECINIDKEEDFIFLQAMVEKKYINVWGVDV